jgi:hypothetical protein
MSKPSVFERVIAESPEEILYLSESHQLAILADAYPRAELQAVVATTYSTGESAAFDRLAPPAKRTLNETADFVGEMILSKCGPDHQIVRRVAGFNVKGHPHIVLASVSSPEQANNFFVGPDKLGEVAFYNTLEVMRFTPQTICNLEDRLAEVSQ